MGLALIHARLASALWRKPQPPEAVRQAQRAMPIAVNRFHLPRVNQDKEVFVMAAQMAKNDRSKTDERDGKATSTAPVGRETLIDGLNHDLAGEYQAVLMYSQYAAKLTGPYRKELRALFLAEIVDEQGHAQFLADKIAVLGGEPTTRPRLVPPADNSRTMLQAVLDAEKQAIADYNQRIEQAEAFGDIGLKVDLENQVADETRHKEEIERILAGWDQR
jgi:bacterioferritin